MRFECASRRRRGPDRPSAAIINGALAVGAQRFDRIEPTSAERRIRDPRLDELLGVSDVEVIVGTDTDAVSLAKQLDDLIGRAPNRVR